MSRKDQPRVLAIGLSPAEIEPASFDCRFVFASALSDAAGELKKNRFDLLIVRADFSEQENVVWVERLRTAKAHLAVLVLSDPDGVERGIEMRLTQAGVVGTLSVSAKAWHLWLAQWLVKRNHGNERHGL